MSKSGIIQFDRDAKLYQTSAKAQKNNPLSSIQQKVIKHKIDLLNLAAELGCNLISAGLIPRPLGAKAG